MIVEPIRRRSRESGRLFALVRDAYLFTLRPVLRFPALSLLIAAIAIGAAAIMYGSVGTDYLPALDEGAFVLDYITPPRKHYRRHAGDARADRESSARDARGRGVLAPHRHATRLHSERIQHRRFFGAAQSQSRSRNRRRDQIGPQSRARFRAGRANRILADAPGSDRRPLGHAATDRGKSIRRGSKSDRSHRAPRRRQSAQHSRHGGRIQRRRPEQPRGGSAGRRDPRPSATDSRPPISRPPCTRLSRAPSRPISAWAIGCSACACAIPSSFISTSARCPK